MASKHTSGPWRFEEDRESYDCGRFVAQDGTVICYFGDSEQYYPTSGSPPEGANRAVMLAAPDLLEALRDLVARCDGDEGVRADGSNIQTMQAHAAIAKAEGGNNGE